MQAVMLTTYPQGHTPSAQAIFADPEDAKAFVQYLYDEYGDSAPCCVMDWITTDPRAVIQSAYSLRAPFEVA